MAKKQKKSGNSFPPVKPTKAQPPPTQQLPPELAQIAGMLPPGIKIEHPPPHFSPELDKALADARKSGGRYMVAVWTMTEDGVTTNLHISNGPRWVYDWLLRAFKLFQKQILDFDPPEDSPTVAASNAGPVASTEAPDPDGWK